MAKYNMMSEWWRLSEAPQNSIEAFNKLNCLAENNARRNPYYRPFEYSCIKRSKRYNRVLKMYWAFYRMEKRENLQYVLEASA